MSTGVNIPGVPILKGILRLKSIQDENEYKRLVRRVKTYSGAIEAFTKVRKITPNQNYGKLAIEHVKKLWEQRQKQKERPSFRSALVKLGSIRVMLARVTGPEQRERVIDKYKKDLKAIKPLNSNTNQDKELFEKTVALVNEIIREEKKQKSNLYISRLRSITKLQTVPNNINTEITNLNSKLKHLGVTENYATPARKHIKKLRSGQNTSRTSKAIRRLQEISKMNIPEMRRNYDKLLEEINALNKSLKKRGVTENYGGAARTHFQHLEEARKKFRESAPKPSTTGNKEFVIRELQRILQYKYKPNNVKSFKVLKKSIRERYHSTNNSNIRNLAMRALNHVESLEQNPNAAAAAKRNNERAAHKEELRKKIGTLTINSWNKLSLEDREQIKREFPEYKAFYEKINARNLVRHWKSLLTTNPNAFLKNYGNIQKRVLVGQHFANSKLDFNKEYNKLSTNKLVENLNSLNGMAFRSRYSGLTRMQRGLIGKYYKDKLQQYNAKYKVSSPFFRTVNLKTAVNNHMAGVKKIYNNAVINAILKSGIPLTNAQRTELIRQKQSLARRAAGVAGSALLRYGGIAGKALVRAGSAAVTALTRSKIEKAMLVMKNPKSTYKEQSEALQSLRSIMSNANATMENRNAAYQAFKNLGRNNSLGFKPRTNQTQSPPEGYNYKNSGIYGPGFYRKTTVQQRSTQIQNTTASSKLGPVNNKIENALSSNNRYTRLERLYELYKSYKNDPDAKRQIIRQIRIIIGKLYGYNVSTSNALRNIGDANKMLRGKVSTNVNKNLNRARATLKSGKHSTYTSGKERYYNNNRNRIPFRMPAAALPAAALPAAAFPVSGAAQPPPVSISISNVGKVSNVGKGNGGGLGVSAPSASGTRTLNATSEQLIRGAGGSEAVEKGIEALRAANGNVAKAKAMSKLPNATFTNIYALGGPVAAKKLVESRRRRRSVGLRARGTRSLGPRKGPVKKKRVVQKPRKKYIKLTPYQFKRLTEHIKKNNLRKVLIKEITH